MATHLSIMHHLEGHVAVVDMLLKAKANPSAADKVVTLRNNYCVML